MKFLLFQEHVGEEEKERILLRRERNRLAATKCRNKKKNKFNLIINKAEVIEKSNNNLRQEIYKLEAEKRHLVRLLMMNKNGTGNNYGSEISGKGLYTNTDLFDYNI